MASEAKLTHYVGAVEGPYGEYTGYHARARSRKEAAASILEQFFAHEGYDATDIDGHLVVVVPYSQTTSFRITPPENPDFELTEVPNSAS